MPSLEKGGSTLMTRAPSLDTLVTTNLPLIPKSAAHRIMARATIRSERSFSRCAKISPEAPPVMAMTVGPAPER
eukprot:scaffold23_cov175-Amphora_coffeaeformis.AAC.5